MSIDWSKPIETVNGHPARMISTDYRLGSEILVTIQIEYNNGSRTAHYHQNGKPAVGGPAIRNRKVKREGWINIYPNNHTGIIIYPTEEDAGKSSLKIATVKIEWEE